MLKKLVVFLLVISICFVFVLFPSCKKHTEGEVLARMDGATLTWDAYDGAASYAVRCSFEGGGGYSVNVKKTSFLAPYTTPGDYVFTVKALDANGDVIALSKPIEYHLGTGEAADAVLIGSADDLKAIAMSYTIAFGKTKVEAPMYYRLSADIDLTGKTVDPIGTSSKPFLGVFDGAGHTIRGLSFTKSNTDGNVGLFGYVKNAVIKNLTVEGASILFNKDSKVGKGELNCGFVAGCAVSSVIDNCHVSGNIDVLSDVITQDNAILSAGGVVGRAESGRVSGVSFTGEIKAQFGRSYAGGLVGFGQGSAPDFLLLNSKANAKVTAVGTAYNVTTNASYAYARAGVAVGNLSHAGRIASILAIGSASVSSTKDGTPASQLTCGVFGRAASDTSSLTIPTYNVFYSDTIQKPVGSTSSLGRYQNNFFPLSEAQMKDRASYIVNQADALNFDDYWEMPADGAPILKKVPTVGSQPSLKLTVASEIDGNDFSYDMMVEDGFLPTYFNLNLQTSVNGLGYNLNDVLSKIGADLNALYEDGQTARIKISADGMDDLILSRTISGTTLLRCYLTYGVHATYESPADIFDGYKFIDAATLQTYDYTAAKHITITFLSPQGAEA